MEYVVIYVLTMSYCMAPEGKTACERRQDTYDFATAEHCVLVRNELVTLYDKVYGNVILYPEESYCKVKAEIAITYPHESEAIAKGERNLFSPMMIPYE